MILASEQKKQNKTKKVQTQNHHTTKKGKTKQNFASPTHSKGHI